MTLRRTRQLLLGATAIACVACGETGSQPVRPVEVIYYVSGATGSRFEVGGIKAANAEHVLCGRTFQTPYFFVLENAFQFPYPTPSGSGNLAPPPICASFRNSEDSPAPIVVSFYTGLTLQRSVELAPGQCTTLPEGADCSDDDMVCTDGEPQFGGRCADLQPVVTGPEVQFEVCRAPVSADDDCIMGVAGPPNVPFNANLGDIRATNVTQCLVTPISALPCTTPATFFLEDAQETATGAFLKVAPAQPNVVLRAELYVDGVRRDVDVTSSELVVTDNL